MISEKPYTLRSIFYDVLKNKHQIMFPEHDMFLMGRDALEYHLASFTSQDQTSVLYPAYSCEDTLLPFNNKKYSVHFYDINVDLTLNLKPILSAIKKHKINVWFIVNYFGCTPVQMIEIKNICKKYNITIIEDISHSLLTSDSGQYGDIVFGSYRKILPLPDGGGALKKKFTQPVLDTEIKSFFSSFAIILKSTGLLKSLKFNRTKIKSLVHSSGRNSKKKYMPISCISKQILKNINFSEIIKARRANFLLWDNLLKGIKYQKIIPKLDPNVCPVGYPILIKQRDFVVNELQKKKIFLKVDWKLSERITKEYKNAHFLSNHSVTLPVHLQMNRRKMLGIKNEMENILGQQWWDDNS